MEEQMGPCARAYHGLVISNGLRERQMLQLPGKDPTISDPRLVAAAFSCEFACVPKLV